MIGRLQSSSVVLTVIEAAWQTGYDSLASFGASSQCLIHWQVQSSNRHIAVEGGPQQAAAAAAGEQTNATWAAHLQGAQKLAHVAARKLRLQASEHA